MGLSDYQISVNDTMASHFNVFFCNVMAFQIMYLFRKSVGFSLLILTSIVVFFFLCIYGTHDITDNPVGTVKRVWYGSIGNFTLYDIFASQTNLTILP